MRAKARESERLSYALNPAAGTMLAAPAGGQAEAEFDFYNDSPDVASFYLEVDGLGPGWASGAGTAYESYAPSSGGGQLRLSLTPPITSTVGEYDFRVRLMSGGAPVNDGTPLILRVDPPLAPPVETFAAPAAIMTAPPPSAAVHTNGVSAVGPPAAPMAEEAVSPVAGEPAAPKTRTSRARPAKRTVAEPMAPVAETVLPESLSLVSVTPVEREAPVPVAPDPLPVAEEPPPTQAIRLAPPPAAPRTLPISPAPPDVTPSRPAPPPTSDEPVLVDYRPRGPGAVDPAVAEDEEDTSITEPFLMDPKDGALIPLRPGETMLLRFPFVNDAPRERTYILDEDRALEEDWLTLVQDQVNLTRNGRGELSVRLTPPVNADPGDYPFTITTGPQGGQILPRVLTLSVLATPAVLLTAKTKTVKIGPFPVASDIVFPLSVESAGNADTSFRVAVKTPQNEATDGGPVGSGDAYESGPWRYLFDKEMETLRSPMAGQTPRPVPISLRVRRKGIWWFGFTERHPLRVAAVPVTEPGNGGKAGNSLDLVAVRTRLLPFPWPFLAALILLIALFQSGGPTDLSVADAAYSNGTAVWIVDPKTSDNKNLHLTWTSKSLALLRFTGAPQGKEDKPPVSQVRFGSGTYTATVPVSTTARDVIYRYRISRLLGGADQDVLAHFIYTRGDTPMIVTDGHGKALDGDNPTLLVPAHGFARLNIRNGAQADNRLNWWLVRDFQDTSAFKFRYHLPSGSKEKGQTEQFLVERNPTAGDPGAQEQIVFVTTDARRPVLTVTLKPAP